LAEIVDKIKRPISKPRKRKAFISELRHMIILKDFNIFSHRFGLNQDSYTLFLILYLLSLANIYLKKKQQFHDTDRN
jgi:hypothetical protein